MGMGKPLNGIILYQKKGNVTVLVLKVYYLKILTVDANMWVIVLS